MRAVFVAAAVWAGGCASSTTGPAAPHAPTARTAPVPAPLSARALAAHVAVLAADDMLGRLAGSAGEARADAYVARAFEAAGVESLPGGAREQSFEIEFDEKSRNVMGFVTGSDPRLAAEVVVVGAHIDHLGVLGQAIYRGAEDNASGVAVLIELARVLAARRRWLGRSVLLVGFGAEEQGLTGSRAFVSDPPYPLDRIVAMVNIDMIGRKLVDQSGMGPLKALLGIRSDGVGVVGTRDHHALRRLVDQACEAAGVHTFAPEDLPDWIRPEVERRTSDRGDNVPFQAAGIPTVFFGAGESDDYHKPTDVIEKLDMQLMARRARAILNTVVALSRAPRPR